MQDLELLQDGLALMALGMGFVFVFLAVLVISVTLMSKLIGRFQPIPVAATESQNSRKSAASSTQSSAQTAAQGDEVVAVISAAVHRYRSTRHR